MSIQYEGGIILSALQSSFIVDCCAVASCALVLYDHLCTLTREVELMWGRRFNSVTLLFYLNRWALILWMISGATSQMLPLGTLPVCVGVNYLEYAMSLVMLTIWAAFSAIRAYAVSYGNWATAITVLLLDLVPVGINAVKHLVLTR
ncbi:hypothetical protein OBBRIDRAFT_798748 [Obba rivulosa]|uniref:DUF6533 domain-containing protein n=1 Tax=Obba rivulosa TaxID=1052685 RepID=A0A8E2AIK8_9APHY|nr:hypothetical protein OBBRIDRAFT_798748 [Obba rivulosa]